MQIDAYSKLLNFFAVFIFVFNAREKIQSHEKFENIEIWRRLGRVISKNYLFKQSLVKYLCKSKKKPKSTRPENFDVFLHKF